MPGFGFNFFWNAANAILLGQSPYAVGDYFSPYPLALLLVPLALLQFLLAFASWIGLKVFLLARGSDRWIFLKAILFFPANATWALIPLYLLLKDRPIAWKPSLEGQA